MSSRNPNYYSKRLTTKITDIKLNPLFNKCKRTYPTSKRLTTKIKVENENLLCNETIRDCCTDFNEYEALKICQKCNIAQN